MYHHHREDELAESTKRAHRMRLNHFLRWCDEQGIENLNNLTGRKLHQFRLWRKRDGDLNRVSVRTQLSTIKQLLRFCETIDAVEPDLYEKVDVPELDKGENARSVMIKVDEAEEILTYLERFEYASIRHVIFLLMWRTAMRTGALRSLDIDDVDLEEGYIQVTHRAEYGTPLKNKSGGERYVAIRQETCHVLEDWIEHTHPEKTDDFGRTPLIGTDYGRVSKSNIRKQAYCATAPQTRGKECSCDTDEHEYAKIHECDDAVSPHALRRGSITHMIRSDVPKEVVSDRADVSGDVLDKHYNEMTEKEKMEKRRGYMSNL
ncbi:phage integrase/site-specific recombinase [Natrialba asiatica DSM 12278]|uniref:Phage integrase/site-specific recombinase n=2 Tax=Natrialba asiatica TaxID=64602 RepID=M0APY6_NATA1|nr:phage integrase/site-specific recombinase [Natrialba asiatica DSM 12278]